MHQINIDNKCATSNIYCLLDIAYRLIKNELYCYALTLGLTIYKDDHVHFNIESLIES